MRISVKFTGDEAVLILPILSSPLIDGLVDRSCVATCSECGHRQAKFGVPRSGCALCTVCADYATQ